MSVRERSRALARPLGWVASALVVGFVIWTLAVTGHADVPGPVQVLAVLAVLAAALAGEHRLRRLGVHRLGASRSPRRWARCSSNSTPT